LLSSDYAYSKSFQVLLYAFLYAKNNNINFEEQNVESGIISFKNLKAGFMKINNRGLGQNELDQFLTQLNKLLVEIYNSEVPFKEKEILLNHF
jgi:ATP-dependent helicase/nuclease subunit B